MTASSKEMGTSQRNYPPGGKSRGVFGQAFSPANFWETLSSQEREIYGSLFSRLSLSVTSPNGILAVHGGLPDLGGLEEIDQSNGR